MGETFRAEGYHTRTETEGRWTLRVTSYRLGDRYVCTVDNTDPGAVLARAEGPTREEVEAQALSKARALVAKTRVSNP